MPIRQLWDRKKMLAETSPEALADSKQDASRGPGLVKAMQQSGVQILAGSDGPDPFVIPGFSLHDELELLVKSGLTPTEALQAATINPATFFEKLDIYGVVEKGYAADLVLLDANPLEDITNTKKISGVVRAGKYYPREELDKIIAASLP
jgi:imidazolonepropionase-like amidohydrolase